MNLSSFNKIYKDILDQELKLSQLDYEKNKPIQKELDVNPYIPTLIFAKTRY